MVPHSMKDPGRHRAVQLSSMDRDRLGLVGRIGLPGNGAAIQDEIARRKLDVRVGKADHRIRLSKTLTGKIDPVCEPVKSPEQWVEIVWFDQTVPPPRH